MFCGFCQSFVVNYRHGENVEFSRIYQNSLQTGLRGREEKDQTHAGISIPVIPKIYQFKKDVNNMSYQYKSVSETCDNGRTGCGIAVIVCYDDGSTAVLQTVSDICGDPEQIRKLVRLCNENQLDPLHLPEVIEDFLGTL